jgi:hypothetical protein
MTIRVQIALLGLLGLAAIAMGQTKLTGQESTPTPAALTNQNTQVVPDMFELGRRVGLAEEDHKRIDRIDSAVSAIEGTLNWMRGAWWALGIATALIAVIVKFFGASLFVAIEHRMAQAREKAARTASP